MSKTPETSKWLTCPEARLRIVARCVLLGLPILWLLATAAWIRIEYYDGLDAISNSRFFAGEFPAFVVNRAPLMGALLTPVRLLVRGWGLHPLAVGPYHALMALFHAVYLLGIYVFLRTRYGETPAVWAAFTSSILNVVFFSYAPFLSHDILPGGMLIAMLVLAERLVDRPSLQTWLWLVFIGACAALLKQTYGLFWLLILASRAVPACLPFCRLQRTPRRGWLALGCGAAVSALIYWLVMGWVLRVNLYDTPFLLRPFRQMVMVMTQYEGTSLRFPAWVYIRNFPFYGLLSAVLLLPGLRHALCKGDRFSQSLALTWLGAVLAMQILAVRELRYLAFLMPLSAFLGAGALTYVPTVRRHGMLCLCLLAVDVGMGIWEAGRLRDPFYRVAPQRRFCDVVLSDSGLHHPVFYTDMLSFTPQRYSPFAGDRYHRMFHVGVRHLQILYGVPLPDLRLVTNPEEKLTTTAAEFPEACLFSSRCRLYNPPRLLPGPPAGMDEFAMAATVSERSCASSDAETVAWRIVSSDGGISLRGPGIADALQPFILPCLRDLDSGCLYAVTVSNIDNAELHSTSDDPVPVEIANWELWGFRIKALAVPDRARGGLEYIFLD